jgi:hypothetical protein
MKLEEIGLGDRDIIPWQVFTDRDILLSSPAKQPSELSLKHKQNLKMSRKHLILLFFSGKVCFAFNSRVGGTKGEYKKNIMQQIRELKPKLVTTLCIVHCVRVGNNPNSSLGRYVKVKLNQQFLSVEDTCFICGGFCFRFLFMPQFWGPANVKAVDESLSSCSAEVDQPALQASFISHLNEMPCETITEQMVALGSIPNFPKWDMVLVADKGGRANQKPNVAASQYLLWSPDEEEGPSGLTVSKYLPASPRNRLMFFMGSGHSRTLTETIAKLHAIDKGEKPPIALADPELLQILNTDDFPEEGVVQPARKKRKHAARLVRMDRVDLSRELGVDLNSMVNCETG